MVKIFLSKVASKRKLTVHYFVPLLLHHILYNEHNMDVNENAATPLMKQRLHRFFCAVYL
jgi:hypothetical protein